MGWWVVVGCIAIPHQYHCLKIKNSAKVNGGGSRPVQFRRKLVSQQAAQVTSKRGERVSGAGPKGWTRADWFPCRFFIYSRYILWLASDCRCRRVLMDGHSEFIAEFNNNSIGGSVA